MTGPIFRFTVRVWKDLPEPRLMALQRLVGKPFDHNDLRTMRLF